MATSSSAHGLRSWIYAHERADAKTEPFLFVTKMPLGVDVLRSLESQYTSACRKASNTLIICASISTYCNIWLSATRRTFRKIAIMSETTNARETGKRWKIWAKYCPEHRQWTTKIGGQVCGCEGIGRARVETGEQNGKNEMCSPAVVR